MHAWDQLSPRAGTIREISLLLGFIVTWFVSTICSSNSHKSPKKRGYISLMLTVLAGMPAVWVLCNRKPQQWDITPADFRALSWVCGCNAPLPGLSTIQKNLQLCKERSKRLLCTREWKIGVGGHHTARSCSSAILPSFCPISASKRVLPAMSSKSWRKLNVILSMTINFTCHHILQFQILSFACQKEQNTF